MWTDINLLLGLGIPFAGTVLGAGMVFLLRGAMGDRTRKLLLGFASGVMVAASVWSLLLPAIDMATSQGGIAWLPAAVGFILGMLFLLLLDTVIPHLHIGDDNPEGAPCHWKRTTMLAMAVTLHNIPEGMAVGVILAGTMLADTGITLDAAFALSIGIAIQNFPEGAIISMPLHSEGMSKAKAFGVGALSGIVEPVAGLLTILLIAVVTPALPYLLAFAAGAMIYVVIEELIPESQTPPHSNISTVGFMAGFVLMMVLDQL